MRRSEKIANKIRIYAYVVLIFAHKPYSKWSKIRCSFCIIPTSLHIRWCKLFVHARNNVIIGIIERKRIFFLVIHFSYPAY